MRDADCRCAQGTRGVARSAIYADAYSNRNLSVAEWSLRDAVGGSHGTDCCREPLVSRRLGERARWSHGLRTPVRAHALSGVSRRRRQRALRAHSARRGHAKRLYLVGPHELLRDCAVPPAGAGVVARGKPHGLVAPSDDATKTRYAARRGEERASLVGRQPTIRDVVGAIAGAGLSRGASISPFAHRVDVGSGCGQPRGHQALLCDLLHA